MVEAAPIRAIRYAVVVLSAAEGVRLIVRLVEVSKEYWLFGLVVLPLAWIFLTAAYGVLRLRRWGPAYATVGAGFFLVSGYVNHLEEGPRWVTVVYYAALGILLSWLILQWASRHFRKDEELA